MPARRDKKTKVRRIERYPEQGRFVGVCEGLGVWSGIDPVWWRVAFVVTTVMWGVGIPVYLLLWICMRVSDDAVEEPEPDDLSPEDREIWDAVKKDMRSLELEND